MASASTASETTSLFPENEAWDHPPSVEEWTRVMRQLALKLVLHVAGFGDEQSRRGSNRQTIEEKLLAAHRFA